MSSPTLANVDVRLSSEDRVSGTVNNCSIALPTVGNVTKVSLQSARFVNSLYNVREGYTFDYVDGGGAQSIAVPAGNYSVYELIDWLNNNVDPNISFTYSETTLRVTVTLGVGTVQVLSNDLSVLLGFPTDSALAASVSGSQAADLSGRSSEVFIRLREIGHARHSSGPMQVYSFHVPLGARGTVSYFSESHDESAADISFAGRGQTSLHFQLVDGRGKELDFSTEWSVILRFTVSSRSRPLRKI